MDRQKGQSLIELLLAVAIFVIIVSSLAFFVLDSYSSGIVAQDITIANFLAEEGLEATRSIRDNSWADLILGDHGLAILGNAWTFSGTQEDVSSSLRAGIRKVIVEDLSPADPNKKRVISQVSWEFPEGQTKQVELTTYLTNWARTSSYLVQLHYRWRNDNGGE